CRLCLIEFRGVVNRIGDPKIFSFFVYVCVPVPWIRVIAHPLRGTTSTLTLDRFEHVCEVARIVTCPGHYVRTQYVRLFLIIAAEPKQHAPNPHLTALRNGSSRSAAKNAAKNLASECEFLIFLLFGNLSGTVPQSHVTDLVSNYPRHLTFIVRSF